MRVYVLLRSLTLARARTLVRARATRAGLSVIPSSKTSTQSSASNRPQSASRNSPVSQEAQERQAGQVLQVPAIRQQLGRIRQGAVRCRRACRLLSCSALCSPRCLPSISKRLPPPPVDGRINYVVDNDGDDLRNDHRIFCGHTRYKYLNYYCQDKCLRANVVHTYLQTLTGMDSESFSFSFHVLYRHSK